MPETSKDFYKSTIIESKLPPWTLTHPLLPQSIGTVNVISFVCVVKPTVLLWIHWGKETIELSCQKEIVQYSWTENNLKWEVFFKRNTWSFQHRLTPPPQIDVFNQELIHRHCSKMNHSDIKLYILHWSSKIHSAFLFGKGEEFT